jgi:hypothetical protein
MEKRRQHTKAVVARSCPEVIEVTDSCGVKRKAKKDQPLVRCMPRRSRRLVTEHVHVVVEHDLLVLVCVRSSFISFNRVKTKITLAEQGMKA